MSLKRPVVSDSLVVVALLVLHVLVVRAVADAAEGWLPAWGAVGLGVLGVGPLAARRQWPGTVFGVVLACAAILVLGGFPTGAVGFALQLALYTVANRRSLRFAVGAGVLVMVTAVASYAADWEVFEAAELLGDAVIVAGAVALGRVARRSTERAQQLEQAVRLVDQTRERLAEEAVLVERNRIARELHDIVAHSLGVIAVRAGVARAMPDDPGQAREAVAVIEATAKDALGEMRHLLGALRSSDTTAADVRPQPGLEQLGELVDGMREVGLSVVFETAGVPHALTAGQELTVYRIVQEALTNVLKHGGTCVRVDLRYGDELEIRVVDDGGGGDGGCLQGYGLIGMRERTLVYGGSLDAGRLADGRFRVVATLPRERAEAVR